MENSLSIFGGFVDLMLIHWPGVSGVRAGSQENAAKRLETWRVLESMHEQGRCIHLRHFQRVGSAADMCIATTAVASCAMPSHFQMCI